MYTQLDSRKIDKTTAAIEIADESNISKRTEKKAGGNPPALKFCYG
jgi:hypothetical protein